MGRQLMDLTGQTFSGLTALRLVPSPSKAYKLWECRCVCGNIIVVRSSSIKRQQSCGKCSIAGELLGDVQAPPIVRTKERFCNFCNKVLPNNRYFNHVDCVDHLDDYDTYSVSQYGVFREQS